MSKIVYEVKNENRKEIFISTAGTSDFSIDRLKTTHQYTAPQGISHWDFSAESINYRVMVEGMSELDIPGFLDGYMHSTLLAGWTLILE